MRGFTKAVTALVTLPAALSAQGILDEFSYEGLKFSGFGIEVGGVASDRLTSEMVGGIKVDYGFFAPNIRLMFGGSYFKGEFDQNEIIEFETRLRGVVDDPTGDFNIEVGSITWVNVEADIDLHYLFPVSESFRLFAGPGLGVHIRNGSGAAVDGTFVEDALDTIAAGINLSGGAELGLLKGLDTYLDLRIALTSELNSASARLGFMFRPVGVVR